MNAYPSWIHRIPEMIEALALVESERIDRRAAELLFGLRRTAAKQLLKRMGAQTCGHSLVISRGLLMARLREAHENPDWRWELERRARVEHALLDVRSRNHRPTVIPVSESERQQLHSQSIAGLPPAIRIAPGELRISFSSADDLLRHLMLLLQAMDNDFGSLLAAVEPLPARIGPRTETTPDRHQAIFSEVMNGVG